MDETTSAMNGKAALAAVLSELGTVPNPDEVAESLWPAFSTAVRAAVAEAKAEELEGLRLWREGRHAPKEAT